jgi:hypothetical protein
MDGTIPKQMNGPSYSIYHKSRPLNRKSIDYRIAPDYMVNNPSKYLKLSFEFLQGR